MAHMALVLQEVAAAATTTVAARLRGSVREARVLADGPQAIYLEAARIEDGAGGCVALLARDAVQVPCGLRTTLAVLPAGSSASLGDGMLVVGDLEVRVRRFVDAGVPRVGPVGAFAMPDGVAGPVLAELGTGPLDLLRDGDAAAVPALLGRGSGLTPLGDDVLCGWLVARLATGRKTGAVGVAVAAQAAARTTTISSTLLCDALRGESVPQVRALLLALRTGADVDARLRALVDVGHTSGSGLALGVALAVGSV